MIMNKKMKNTLRKAFVYGSTLVAIFVFLFFALSIDSDWGTFAYGIMAFSLLWIVLFGIANKIFD